MMDWNEETSKFDIPSACGGTYTCGLVITPEQHRELRVEGCFNIAHSKMMPDGNERINFKRKHEQFDRKGRPMTWASGAPKVTDKDGNPWDKEENGLIWNGSEIEVTYEQYGDRKFWRLVSVKVLKAAEAPTMDDDSLDKVIAEAKRLVDIPF
jgi:hypothetical protein